MRARGGAILVENSVGADKNIMEKSKLHIAEKRVIGMKSAQLIADDETIILESGTTTAEIAKNLDDIENLTVVTNAINIVSILAEKRNITLIVPGGVLRQKSSSLVGPLAESNFRNFFVDKALISSDGLDVNQGIFTPNIGEASLNRIMINSARKVILVADSSKFTRRSLVLICSFNKINTLVTDNGIPTETKKKLLEQGIEIIIE